MASLDKSRNVTGTRNPSELGRAVDTLREIRSYNRELPSLPDCPLKDSIIAVIESAKNCKVDEVESIVTLADNSAKFSQLLMENKTLSNRVRVLQEELDQAVHELRTISESQVPIAEAEQRGIPTKVKVLLIIIVIMLVVVSFLREPTVPKDGSSPSLNRQHIRKED